MTDSLPDRLEKSARVLRQGAKFARGRNTNEWNLAASRLDEAAAALRSQQEPKNHLVTVCDRCLTSACWQGIFMCDLARDAGTFNLPFPVVERLALENSDYWELPPEQEG